MAVMRKPGRLGSGAALAAATLLGLGLGAAVPAVAHAEDGARGAIVQADSAEAIDGSYIVILKDSAFSATSQRAEALADSHDAKVTTVYRHALNGFAAEMSEADARELAADPAVAKVVQNERVHVTATQPDPPSWGQDRIDQPDLPLDDSFTYPDSAGAGVTAYVVDTGVRYTHEEFGGRAHFGFDAFGGDGSDGYGHGTHVAGTLAGETYGLAKEAEIVSVRVLDETGSGTIEEVVAGVDFVAGDVHGPAVANMSLGGGANDALDEAVRNAIDAGVVFAVAAGNDYGRDAGLTSPARVEEAITVGASDEDDARSYFSNVGSVVDLFAPGTAITSAWNSSDTASDTISGTSMATPHVAGAAALYLADHPDATPAEVQDHLVNSAVYFRLSDIPGNTVNALLHTGGQGGAPELPDGPRFTNSASLPINDYETTESTIEVDGVGVVDGLFQVDIDITHSWVGDLTVELVAPDGTTRVLQDRTGGSADDLVGTFTLSGSGVDADGTWTLAVTDNAGLDEGTLNSWALQF